MSGTPLQNNTFDIFAQMNFLNPGMLGTMEFFRQEFAIPIDKFGEQERKEHLQKILYPFILRRTKEQVAKDLPDKTETFFFVKWEMSNEKFMMLTAMISAIKFWVRLKHREYKNRSYHFTGINEAAADL